MPLPAKLHIVDRKGTKCLTTPEEKVVASLWYGAGLTADETDQIAWRLADAYEAVADVKNVDAVAPLIALCREQARQWMAYSGHSGVCGCDRCNMVAIVARLDGGV